MSTWKIIERERDVTVSENGKNLEILYETDDFGNNYIEVPMDFILSAIEEYNNSIKLIRIPNIKDDEI